MSAPQGMRTPWLLLGICVLFLVVLPVALVRHWRGRSYGYDRQISAAFFRSERLRRGHVRALPVVFVSAIVACLAFVALFLAPPAGPGGADPYRRSAVVVLLVAACLGVVLYWTVVLTNRPRFVVAPYLRDEVGDGHAGRDRTRSRRAGGTASGGELSFEVMADGGLISIGDRDARDSPLWEDTTTAAVSDGTVVLVGVRPSREGPVGVRVVRAGHGDGGEAHEAFAGRLHLPSGVLQVGSVLAHELEYLDLSPASAVTVRVLVDVPDSASSVTILVAADR